MRWSVCRLRPPTRLLPWPYVGDTYRNLDELDAVSDWTVDFCRIFPGDYGVDFQKAIKLCFPGTMRWIMYLCWPYSWWRRWTICRRKYTHIVCIADSEFYSSSSLMYTSQIVFYLFHSICLTKLSAFACGKQWLKPAVNLTKTNLSCLAKHSTVSTSLSPACTYTQSYKPPVLRGHYPCFLTIFDLPWLGLWVLMTITVPSTDKIKPGFLK